MGRKKSHRNDVKSAIKKDEGKKCAINAKISHPSRFITSLFRKISLLKFWKVLKDKIDIKDGSFTVDLFFYVIFKKKCFFLDKYNIIRFFRNSCSHINAFAMATRMSLSWRIYMSLAHRTKTVWHTVSTCHDVYICLWHTKG